MTEGSDGLDSSNPSGPADEAESLRGETVAESRRSPTEAQQPTRTRLPTSAANVFLSYSREDGLEFARELHRRFVRDGIACFFDQESIEWGENYVLALENGVASCDHVVTLLTPGFVASEWTALERTSAMAGDPGKLRSRLLPLLLAPCDTPPFLRPIQYLDVSSTKKFETAYPKICEKLGGTPQPDAEPLDLSRSKLPPVVPLPTRHRMPYRSLRSRFAGRVEPLYEVHDLLIGREDSRDTEGVCAVTGTGGLGKTQIAIEYVHRFGNHYPGGVFWVDADQSREKAIQDLADMAEVDIDGALPVDTQIERLWQNLDELRRPTLIVFDNFRETVALRPWLPSSAHIKTLVTTRRQDLGYAKAALDFMDDVEALELLNMGERAFGNEARPLIEALGGLPLALELARNFLERRKTVTVHDLVAEIERLGAMSVLTTFAEKYADELPTLHEKEVAATFHLSWNQATEDAQRILMFMSHWAPAPVPRRLLHAAWSDADSVLDDPVGEALAHLENLSVVELDEDQNPRLHRLLHAFAQVRASAAEDNELRTLAHEVIIDEISRATLNADGKLLNELAQVEAHAATLLDSEHLESEHAISIASGLGHFNQNLGRFELSRAYFQRALDLAEARYDPEHPSIAICQSDLALILRDLGQFEGAKELLERALIAANASYEPEHPRVLIPKSNLALALQDLDELERAKNLLEQVLAADEVNYEPGHPRIAISQSNLAMVLQGLGELERAKDLLEQALAADKASHEPGHPSIAIRQSNLSTVLEDLGELERAKALAEQALNATEASYEPGHPRIAANQSNLAMVLQDLGELERAKDLLEQALAADEINYEPGHPRIAVRQSNLALVLQDLGELERAKDLLEQALTADEASYEPEHPSIAISQNNLALVLKDLGELERAKDLLEQALSADKVSYKPGHPRIATLEGNLAAVLEDLGEL